MRGGREEGAKALPGRGLPACGRGRGARPAAAWQKKRLWLSTAEEEPRGFGGLKTPLRSVNCGVADWKLAALLR